MAVFLKERHLPSLRTRNGKVSQIRTFKLEVPQARTNPWLITKDSESQRQWLRTRAWWPKLTEDRALCISTVVWREQVGTTPLPRLWQKFRGMDNTSDMGVHVPKTRVGKRRAEKENLEAELFVKWGSAVATIFSSNWLWDLCTPNLGTKDAPENRWLADSADNKEWMGSGVPYSYAPQVSINPLSPPRLWYGQLRLSQS